MSKNRNTMLKGKSKEFSRGLGKLSLNEEAIEKSKNKFVVSFKDLDRNQGQTFEDWNEDGLLVNMLNTLREYCQKTMQENKSDKFKVYGYFPPKYNFKHTKHIPEDANWACLHITGKNCIAGHVIENIFYVVFLDKNHEFWITEKKHT